MKCSNLNYKQVLSLPRESTCFIKSVPKLRSEIDTINASNISADIIHPVRIKSTLRFNGEKRIETKKKTFPIIAPVNQDIRFESIPKSGASNLILSEAVRMLIFSTILSVTALAIVGIFSIMLFFVWLSVLVAILAIGSLGIIYIYNHLVSREVDWKLNFLKSLAILGYLFTIGSTILLIIILFLGITNPILAFLPLSTLSLGLTYLKLFHDFKSAK